jgi:hypothetical protein
MKNQAYKVETHNAKVSDEIHSVELRFGRWFRPTDQNSRKGHREVLWPPLFEQVSGRVYIEMI